jgi:hypothetical protein
VSVSPRSGRNGARHERSEGLREAQLTREGPQAPSPAVSWQQRPRHLGDLVGDGTVLRQRELGRGHLDQRQACQGSVIGCAAETAAVGEWLTHRESEKILVGVQQL